MTKSDMQHNDFIINENLSKNIELYNKYTMLLAAIFISALTAIGQHKAYFNLWLKISIILFSISLSMTLLELAVLIIRDSTVIDASNYNFFKRISIKSYSAFADVLSIISLAGFLFGIVTINIFVFTL